jgi:hypothetical protein
MGFANGEALEVPSADRQRRSRVNLGDVVAGACLR